MTIHSSSEIITWGLNENYKGVSENIFLFWLKPDFFRAEKYIIYMFMFLMFLFLASVFFCLFFSKKVFCEARILWVFLYEMCYINKVYFLTPDLYFISALVRVTEQKDLTVILLVIYTFKRVFKLAYNTVRSASTCFTLERY